MFLRPSVLTLCASPVTCLTNTTSGIYSFHTELEMRHENITDERARNLNREFLDEPLCYLRGGLCWWVRQKQLGLSAEQQLDLFRDIFDSWSKRVRSATLNEEEWHVFGKCEAKGGNCWAADYSRQCTSHVIEGSRREYHARGNVVSPSNDVDKAFARQRILGSTALAMTRGRRKKVGFGLKPIKLKPLKSNRQSDIKFEQAVEPLKRGGESLVAVASRELKGKVFNGINGYRNALKLQISDVISKGRAVASPAIVAANQAKSLDELRRSLETTTQLPETTPWSMGGGGWPVRPELVTATITRLLAAARAADATAGYKSMIDPVKESLNKLVDQKTVADSSTIQSLLGFFNANSKIVEALPCGAKHFGLCEQRDSAFLAKSFALASLLCKYTALKIPKAREGKVCFMFRSAAYVFFAFQAKVRRRPQWQGYVAHAIEDKECVQMAADPYRCPLLPVHRVQDCHFPVVVKLHQYSEGPMAGYMGVCNSFGIARALFSVDNTNSWDVATVDVKCLSAERCEIMGDCIDPVGAIREGEVVQ